MKDTMDRIFDKVVRRLKPREIRGVWIGFDCSEFDSVCGDAVLLELARGKNNHYILAADRIIEFQSPHKILDFFTKSSDVAYGDAFAFGRNTVVHHGSGQRQVSITTISSTDRAKLDEIRCKGLQGYYQAAFDVHTQQDAIKER